MCFKLWSMPNSGASQISVRSSCDADLPAITEIYNDAVVTTVAVWNNDTVDVDNRRDWLHAHQVPGTVALTAVGADGRVLGYATYGDFRSYDGFRDTVENSVYVSTDARTGGVGTALMTELLSGPGTRASMSWLRRSSPGTRRHSHYTRSSGSPRWASCRRWGPSSGVASR